MYLYENADITGRAKVENGLKCNGPQDGAKWLIDEDDKEQLYKFTKNGFTLLAIVKIEKNNKKVVNSLLGFVLKGNEKPVGLLCSNESKWILRNEGKLKILEKSEQKCEQGKTYNIAFILKKDNNLAIYVDGKQLEFLDNEAIKINEGKSITHFYFGANIGTDDSPVDESYVTVANVLLYNRPLPSQEIKKLQPKKNNEKIVQQITQSDTTNQHKHNGGTTTTGSPLDTSDTQTSTDNTNDHSSFPPPPTPTTEDGAVRVGVVGVLCFMLFGVFTLLGRYVY